MMPRHQGKEVNDFMTTLNKPLFCKRIRIQVIQKSVTMITHTTLYGNVIFTVPVSRFPKKAFCYQSEATSTRRRCWTVLDFCLTWDTSCMAVWGRRTTTTSTASSSRQSIGCLGMVLEIIIR